MMDPLTILGIATASGTVAVQIYYGGKLVNRFENLEKRMDDEVRPILDQHEQDLHNHHTRITVLEQTHR